MKKSKLKNKSFRILFCILHLAFLTSAISAQSINQSYPTAITSNEITGRIVARDIGDARLTSYFYVFGGSQGDVFINVQTSNFNGDVDVFTQGNLKPLTKITIYADDTNSETGRVVYLRQPAKLILRIQGRSPNDEAATFRIKFAGSFEPAQAVAENSASEAPEVKSENQTDVRVNSVGTILEVKPKPLPSPKETIAKKEVKSKDRKTTSTQEANKNTEEKEVATDENQPTRTDVKENTTEDAKDEDRKQETTVEKSEVEDEKNIAPVVIITDNTAKKDEAKTDREVSPEETKETSVGKTETKAENNPENSEATAVKPKARTKSKKVKEPNPLDNIQLVIIFKDGTKIERAMSEVIKVGVDKGTLTVIAKDGSIGRYSILDVAKMTIE